MSRDEWNALVEEARARDMIKVAQAHDAKLSRYGHSGEYVGACPVCGTGHDRFAINPKKGVFNCRVCGKGGHGAVDLEMFLGGCEFVEAVKRLTNTTTLNGKRLPTAKNPEAAAAHERARERDEQEQHETASWLWAQRHPIAGTIAERYLREARGITCALPATLAFLPARKPEHHPAMIAAFALVDKPEPGVVGKPQDVGSVHLTLLKPDGSGKAEIEKPKIIIGSPSVEKLTESGDVLRLGLPIVVAPPNDLLGLAITEGIEDALTAHQLTGLGAWAAGAAGFMPKLAAVVPDYIEAVTIYAHPDEAGQDGAHELVTTLRQRRIEAVVEGLLS
jgi:putative DNA primase/helicase